MFKLHHHHYHNQYPFQHLDRDLKKLQAPLYQHLSQYQTLFRKPP